MTYSFDGSNLYLLKLNKGEHLSAAIEQFVHEVKAEGASISGLGGALEMTLGYYDLDAKEYKWKTYNGLYEVLSLTGNLAFDEDGKMMFHLHGVFGDAQYQTIGGHVKDLTVGATLELCVYRTHVPLKRKNDSDVGLQTLDL